MKIDRRRARTTLAALVALVAAAALAAPPARAQHDTEETERRVVKKIRVECGGGDCEEHLVHHGRHRLGYLPHAGGGYLGVLLADLTPELRSHFGVGEDAGVMISKVVDDSPAARAGLEVGDIVTAVDGEPIGSSGMLARSIRRKKDGAAVLLAVWRDGSVRNLTATVEEREDERFGMGYAYVLECDDEESDCTFTRRHHGGGNVNWNVDFDCGGDAPCEVQVKCEGEDRGDCVCTVNGEEADCSELPGFDG